MDNQSPDTDKSLIVLGAGPMGLATAYYALKAGYKVDILEADDRPGGMAAHFDFDGLSIERFYHFCCLSDEDTFELLEELGAANTMKWVSTKMGYYLDGRLIRWGNPVALLFAPGIDLITKIRYGLQAFSSTLRSDWKRLDKISAKDWFVGWLGNKGYERFWKPLMDLKFYELSERISAAWVWQRIKRIGKSRKSLLEERLGYIEGGTEALITRLVEEIECLGGKIHYSSRASSFVIEENTIKGVKTESGDHFSSANVISTIPIPFAKTLFDESRTDLTAPYEMLENVGVVCIVHKLSKRVTDNFWVNISDDRMDIPGFVEFSNLRPTGDDHIVYIPYYMPQTNPLFSEGDDYFVEKSFGYLQMINPDLASEDLKASHVARLKYAQPVCDVGFADKIPDPQTPVSGLQIADTSFYYPEDRGVSESIKYAKRLVSNLERESAG
jgi:protoporphyrinogen oxidase